MTKLDDLWAAYGAAGKPLGDPELAFALGAASYRPDDRDWGAGLSMRRINMLDLTHFRRGWESAKTNDDFTAWRNAWMPGGE